MRDSGIRCLRSVQRQPDGTYIVDVELDIGIIVQGVSVRGNVAEAPVHIIERTKVVNHPTYRSTYRKQVPEPTFVYVSLTAKGLCINNRFTIVKQCGMVDVWSAPLVERRVFGSVTRDYHLF
jgi:hypothetical protein